MSYFGANISKSKIQNPLEKKKRNWKPKEISYQLPTPHPFFHLLWTRIYPQIFTYVIRTKKQKKK